MVQKHGTINEYFTVQHGIVSLIIYVYVIVSFIIYVSGYIRRAERTQEKEVSNTQGQSEDTVKESTTWKVSKYGVFSGPYFPAFGPEKTSAFGHFSRSGHGCLFSYNTIQNKKSIITSEGNLHCLWLYEEIYNDRKLYRIENDQRARKVIATTKFNKDDAHRRSIVCNEPSDFLPTFDIVVTV